MKWIKDRFPIVIIFLIMGCAYVFSVWHYQTGQNYKGSNYSNPVAQSVIPPIHKRIKGISSNPDERKQEQKEKSFFEVADHKAQIRMADYALIGILLGIFGSYLLMRTLIYTRDAARLGTKTLDVAQETLTETKKSTRLEMQPYLSCEDVRLTGKIIGDNEISLKGVARIKNNGKTPANIRWCKNETSANFGEYNWTKNRAINSRQFLYVAPNSTEEVHLVFDFKFTKERGRPLDYNTIYISGNIFIGYMDEFSIKGKESVACFSFFSPDNSEYIDGEGFYLSIKGTYPIHIQERKEWEELKNYNTYK